MATEAQTTKYAIRKLVLRMESIGLSAFILSRVEVVEGSHKNHLLCKTNPKQTQSNPISNQTSIAVQHSKRYNIDTDGLLNPKKRPLKSEYGGERFRPDGRKASCMSRTPVGLVNHPATNLIGNYQLQMAA